MCDPNEGLAANNNIVYMRLECPKERTQKERNKNWLLYSPNEIHF